jgi:hypothetical protein
MHAHAQHPLPKIFMARGSPHIQAIQNATLIRSALGPYDHKNSNRLCGYQNPPESGNLQQMNFGLTLANCPSLVSC